MKDRVGRYIELFNAELGKVMATKTSFGRTELSVELGRCTIVALTQLNAELEDALLAKDRNR
jgi:hypothetical protein